MEDIVFGSVLNIINHYRYCPLCKHSMTLHRGSSGDQVIYNDQELIIKNRDYTVTIDFYSDVINIEENASIDTLYDSETIKYRQSTPKSNWNRDGLLLLGITLECGNIHCTKYSYTISLDLDLTARRFKRASLNAEWVCVEDGLDVFEIRNSHSMGITKYSHHSADGSTKSIEIPLIPINSLNPKETLERLKKLIIFT